jgi:hypothetical protein
LYSRKRACSSTNLTEEERIHELWAPMTNKQGRRRSNVNMLHFFIPAMMMGGKNLILEDTIVTCRKESQLSMIGGFITLL